MARPNSRPQRDLSNVPEIDWARLSAYIDSDGHISIASAGRKQKSGARRRYLRVAVTNTDPRLIRWLVSVFGGAVSRYSRTNPKHRFTMKWHASCRQAEAILQRCRPFFIAKREQAEIAIAFQQTCVYRRGHEVPADVQTQREQYVRDLTDERWRVHDASDLRRDAPIPIH